MTGQLHTDTLADRRKRKFSFFANALLKDKKERPALNFLSGFLSLASFSTFASRAFLFVGKYTNKNRTGYAKLAKELNPSRKTKTPAKKFYNAPKQYISKLVCKFETMKNYKTIIRMTTSILTIIFLLFSTSCSKWGYDKVQDFQEVKIPCSSLTDQQYIINDSTTYYSIINTTNCTPLQIDFTQKTLLGKYTSATGCRFKYERQLYVNHDDKDYLYIIKVKESGWCKIDGSSMNWIVVPKIPADYSITFKIK